MPQPQHTGPLLKHATTIAIRGQAVMIEGPSGSGKSALALQIMGLGAGLVADDATLLTAYEEGIVASAPDSLPAAIEARGIGLLNAPLTGPMPLRLVVDLGHLQSARLPQPMTRNILGHSLPLLHKVDNAHFPSALWHYVIHGGTLSA